MIQVSSFRHIRVFLFAALFLFTAVYAVSAADRDRVKAFLEVTGFDVALDSIALSAGAAPQMLGVDAGIFGSEWVRISEEVFDPAIMQAMALDILERALGDEELAHAAEFYASDLGRELVVVENRSHMDENGEEMRRHGEELVSELERSNPARLDLLDRMNTAIDAGDSSLQAIQEVRIRFLLAASAAGIIDMDVDVDGLRALFREQDEALREEIQESALAGSAATYEDIGTEDLLLYAEALEHPLMQNVYELLNATQFEIMANRFEALAIRMAGMRPGQDI